MKLEGGLSVVPLLNIVLLGRDLFEGSASAAMGAVVVASTLLYALAAIAVASRIFGAESVLYSEQTNWADLFRRPRQPLSVPTITSALLCLAFMFPTLFLLQSIIRLAGPDLQVRFVLMPVVSIVLFAGLPLLAAVLGRVRLASGFQWHKASVLSYAAGILLGVSLWQFVLQIIWVQIGGSNANLARFRELVAIVIPLQQLPLAAVVF